MRRRAVANAYPKDFFRQDAPAPRRAPSEVATIAASATQKVIAEAFGRSHAKRERAQAQDRSERRRLAAVPEIWTSRELAAHLKLFDSDGNPNPYARAVTRIMQEYGYREGQSWRIRTDRLIEYFEKAQAEQDRLARIRRRPPVL